MRDLDNERLLKLSLTRWSRLWEKQQTVFQRSHNRNTRQLPWLQMIRLRNRLIHGYDQMDLDILWNIVEQDLPGLISQLQDIVSDR